MKRTFAALTAVLIATAGLSACTSTPSPEPTQSASDQDILALPRVEFVVPVNSSPFWDEVKRGASAAGKDFKVTIMFNGPDKASDSAGYLKLLRNALKHNNLIGVGVGPQVAAAADIPATLAPAQGTKISVVAVGAPIAKYDAAIATVMSNNQWIGENAAKQMTNVAGQTGSVAVLTSGDDPATGARADAFSAFVKKTYKTVTVVAPQDGGGTRANAKKAAQKILADNPDLVGFFGTDSVTTLGIADAVASVKGSKVTIVGVDADTDEITAVQKGTITGAYAQNGFNVGYQTVSLIVNASKGTPPKDKTMLSDVVWYTKSNLKDPAVSQIVLAGKSAT